MNDSAIDVSAHVIDVAAQDERLLHYLDGLSDEQLKGYENFKTFMVGQLPIATWRGSGGTGKTHSAPRWCQAFGLKPDEVIGISPMNEAARMLRKSFHSAGFPCQVTTCHSFLGLTPTAAKWTIEEDLELATLRDQLTKEADPVKLTQITARVSLLKRQLHSFNKEELVFTMGDWFVRPEKIKLFFVDECGMIPEEIDNLIDSNLIYGNTRIIKMGDDMQLFPVSEGMSPSFNAPTLIEFRDIRRCSGELRELNLLMRQSQNVTTSYHILKSLPRYNGVELESNKACTITRTQAKRLFGEWSKSLPRDGKEYRYIGFKRELVSRINTASLQFAGQPSPPLGSHLIADSPVSRWCFNEGNKTLLFNGERVAIQDVAPTYRASIPGFGEIDVHQLLVRCGDDEDPYDRRIDLPGTEYWEKPYHFLGQGQRKTIQRMNLVKWSNDPVLYEAIEFWGKIKSALYSSKAPTPGANEAVELFFEWMGMDSWTNVKGVPGYKTHKPKSLNVDLFLDPAKVGHQSRKDFLAKISDNDGSIICEIGKGRSKRGLRSQVYALYMWLQNTVVDPVKPVAASTVYKAQGNSIKQVMIDLEDLYKSRHYGDKGGENAARALYTAVSRASEKLYIVVND